MNPSRSPLATWLIILGLLLFAALLGGCGGSEGGNPGTAQMYVDDSSLENYIKEQYASAVVPRPGTSSDQGTTGGDGGNLPPEVDGDKDFDSGSREHSDTNVQELGVDESDKVKTDGDHLYLARDRAVTVIHLGDDGAMEVVAMVAASGAVDSLYLYDHYLVVLYHPPGDRPTDWCVAIDPIFGQSGIVADIPCWIPTRTETGLLIVDIGTPDRPSVVRDIVLDGNLVSSRRIGSRIHLITQFVPLLPPLEPFYDEAVESKETVIERNLQALDGVTLDDLVPSFESRNGEGELVGGGRLITTGDFVSPEAARGGSVTAVTTVDLDAPQAPPTSVAALLDARHVYASTRSLYLVVEQYLWQASSILTTTTIHKFDLSNGRAVFVGSGEVEGGVLDRYSLGEHESVLRVATTTGDIFDGSASTHVFCLREGAEGMEIIGRLDGLAPGERLYAARFLGARGFLVTFVKVDPLFTLDLSDPTRPRAVGELKVPGFSEYIHPLGENHLLTIGKDAVPDDGFAWYQGLQLSLFDVSDFADPKLVYVEKIGDRGTGSQALHDPKAFTFWAARDLLALPVDLYEHTTPPQHPSDFGTYLSSGLYVYRVTVEEGFALLGRIETTLATASLWPSFGGWTRGLFAGQTVYAATPEALHSAAIDDIGQTARILELGE